MTIDGKPYCVVHNEVLESANGASFPRNQRVVVSFRVLRRDGRTIRTPLIYSFFAPGWLRLMMMTIALMIMTVIKRTRGIVWQLEGDGWSE